MASGFLLLDGEPLCCRPLVKTGLQSRTRRIVCEPRADNARMIQHLQALGFARLKEFDFPHKRAALMVLEREAFFARCRLA